MEHAGLRSLFDRAGMRRDCYENVALEGRGKANFREQNPLHAPYCALSKVISGYAPPDMERCVAVGEKRGDAGEHAGLVFDQHGQSVTIRHQSSTAQSGAMPLA